MSQRFLRKIIFTTFNFCFLKLCLVTFHPLHYQLVTITLHKISICHKLQYYNGNLLTDAFSATVWIFMLEDFGCSFCWKFERQIRTGCKLRMRTVVMFASLPHAVNFFSKPSDQYYIAVPFSYAGVIYKSCNNLWNIPYDNIQSRISQIHQVCLSVCLSVLQSSDNSWIRAAIIFVGFKFFHVRYYL